MQQIYSYIGHQPVITNKPNWQHYSHLAPLHCKGVPIAYVHACMLHVDGEWSYMFDHEENAYMGFVCAEDLTWFLITCV